MFKSRYVHARMLMIDDVFHVAALRCKVTDVSINHNNDVVIKCHNVLRPLDTIILVVPRNEVFKINKRK